MKLRPTSEDRRPREVRFWVGTVSGGVMSNVRVTETPKQIAERIENEFPTERLKRYGRGIIGSLTGRE